MLWPQPQEFKDMMIKERTCSKRRDSHIHKVQRERESYHYSHITRELFLVGGCAFLSFENQTEGKQMQQKDRSIPLSLFVCQKHLKRYRNVFLSRGLRVFKAGGFLSFGCSWAENQIVSLKSVFLYSCRDANSFHSLLYCSVVLFSCIFF